MSQAVARRDDPKELATVGEKIDALAVEYGPKALAPLAAIARSIKLAEGVRQTRELVLKIVPHLRHLAGTPLGFKTDKDRGGQCEYDDRTLAEALTEAALRGFRWTGNEMNIIAGRFYATKEGYQRAVRDIPGLTDLYLIPGVPKGSEGGAVVPFRARWRLDGKPMELERNIPVKLNNGMGADGAIGKATRKMLASIHFTCTGSEQSASDGETDPTDPAEVPPAPTRAAELRERLTAGPTPPAAPPPGDGRLFPDQSAGNMPD